MPPPTVCPLWAGHACMHGLMVMHAAMDLLHCARGACPHLSELCPQIVLHACFLAAHNLG